MERKEIIHEVHGEIPVNTGSGSAEASKIQQIYDELADYVLESLKQKKAVGQMDIPTAIDKLIELHRIAKKIRF